MNQTAQKPKKAANAQRNSGVASVASGRRRVSRAKFAAVCEVARSTITRALRGELGPALVGNSIDLDHPVVDEWLIARGLGPEVFDASAPRPTEEIEEELGDSKTVPLDSILSMTFGELTARWRSDEIFLGWIRGRKELAMSMRAEAQLARLHGRLVPRTLVDHALSTIDALHVRLLRDVARNLANRLTNNAYSPEEAEKYIRDQISTQLRAAKEQVARAIRADDIDAPLKDPAPND